MEDITGAVRGTLEVVKAAHEVCKKVFDFLSKNNLLAMTEKRKVNLRNKAQIELELDAQKRHHQRMDLADAEVRARIALMESSTNLAIEATEKAIKEGASYEEASQRCLPFAARATANLYRETLQCEYAKERIGLYALQAAAENPDAKCAEGEVSETWNAQFWDYAKNIRDEEAMRQWGRLLATEVQSPGSIPIKALDTLRTLAPKQAKDFYALQKFSVAGAIPIFNITLDNLAFIGLNVYDISLLESNSLIFINRSLSPPKGLRLKNKFYAIKIPKGITINCIFLTDIGEALSSISNNTEEDALAGATYFADYLKKHNGITVEIEKISG